MFTFMIMVKFFIQFYLCRIQIKTFLKSDKPFKKRFIGYKNLTIFHNSLNAFSSHYFVCKYLQKKKKN